MNPEFKRKAILAGLFALAVLMGNDFLIAILRPLVEGAAIFLPAV